MGRESKEKCYEIEVKEMHYAKFKKDFAECPTIPKSYNKDTKTIKVIIQTKNELTKEKLIQQIINKDLQVTVSGTLGWNMLKKEEITDLQNFSISDVLNINTIKPYGRIGYEQQVGYIDGRDNKKYTMQITYLAYDPTEV